LKEKRTFPVLLTVAIILLALQSSCTLEKKLGKEFLAKAPEISIQLLTPEMLFKYNHKGENIPGFDSLTGPQQDSALFADSRFIRNVDDSLFLDRYVNSFIDELRAIGFKVYVDGMIDSLFRIQPQSYVLNMAQVQLDEYFEPYEDSEDVGDTVFTKHVDLNAVDASSWLELNKYNTVKPVKTVLYSSFTASDGFSGNFLIDDYNVRYRYRVDSLKVNDIYDLASFSGRRHASYLFDYFMNQYIAHHMPEGYDILGYLHYERGKYLDFTNEERFEVLQSK
jgi:hypothetical protein